MDAGIIVVGAGQAACQLVASLRQAGYAGALTMIGAEPHLPYQRPPLSKGCLHGNTGLPEILLRPASFYDLQRCQLLLARSVEALDVARKVVLLDDGQALPYKRLVLATGARARCWPGLPKAAPQVFSLRTWDDAQALGKRLPRVQRLAVLGAGYVGLEVAASARRLGLEVSVFESAPRVMQRSVGLRTSGLVERLHTEQGVQLQLGTHISSVALADDTRDAVQLETAVGRFGADALVVGIGAEPRIELAKAAGLVCGQAIRTDASCRTSNPDIFAIGDCAEQVLRSDMPPSRLESVQNAIDQAKCAAAALTGKPLPPVPVPWFWSDQFGCRIQVAGRAAPADEPVLRARDETPFAQGVWYLRDERVVAVEAVDAPEEFMAARQLIRSGQRVDRARLTDMDVALSSLVARA